MFTGNNLLLTNRCTILKPTISPDGYNTPRKTFSALAENVKCRLMNARGRTLNTKENTAIVIDFLLYLPFGQEIKESYKVNINGQDYEVLFVDKNVANANHHVEASLRIIKGANT